MHMCRRQPSSAPLPSEVGSPHTSSRLFSPATNRIISYSGAAHVQCIRALANMSTVNTRGSHGLPHVWLPLQVMRNRWKGGLGNKARVWSGRAASVEHAYEVGGVLDRRACLRVGACARARVRSMHAFGGAQLGMVHRLPNQG